MNLRILLAHNSTFYPAHGGGDKSNRLLMQALAARGHDCRVVARLGSLGNDAEEHFLTELERRQVAWEVRQEGVVIIRRKGVEIHTMTTNPHLRQYFAEQIEDFQPDVILASTDDPAQLMLEPALKAPRARVVYLARASLALPFGPDCAFPSPAKTEMLRRASAVVGVSEYVARYIHTHSGIPAVHVPISLQDPGPYPDLGSFDNEFVTMVNPCATKGIAIFLELARRLPQVRFAAVPTWGTTHDDRRALAELANITLLDPVDQIDDLLRRTKVLLVPSLWAEARSRIVVEAMLRGVPVIASDVGGMAEAKMGVPYLLPVRPIEHYSRRLDEQMVPVAIVPPQNVDPWEQVLSRLLTDRQHFEELSRLSSQVARQYVANLSVEPFVQLLYEVVRTPRREPEREAPHPEPAAAEPSPASRLEALSPEKRRLLTILLKKRGAQAPPANRWFPFIEQARPGQIKLFCFPPAGGGAASFQELSKQLPARFSVQPARLPGRESRLSEAAPMTMEDLVDGLFGALRPHLEAEVAFLGHSMGAVVGFELCRRLRKEGLALPAVLVVMGARAPQFRRGHVPPPDPPDEQLLAELNRLEGIPPEVFDNEELIRVLLPALRADTALYRRYVYAEEPPLTCAIRAYGGDRDPNVQAHHLEAWREQTTASFAHRLLPGGHFFYRRADSPFAPLLAEDLAQFFR